MRNLVSCVALGVLLSGPAFAGMVADKIDYTIGDDKFQGVLVYDDSVSAKRPAVLMAPNWMGVTDAAVTKAKLLAGSKYVYFVADMYTAGVRPTGPKEAGAAAGPVRGNVALGRARINKAMDVLLAEGEKRGIVDPSRTAAIGFCFGGGNVLELARSGRAVDGVVTFHGDLKAVQPGADMVKSKVLILHGADDPGQPKAARDAIETELTAAKVDYQLIAYANTVHSFTDPGANIPGRNMYSEIATKRSFAAMENFFEEIF